jgi:hypothetical protein
MLFAQLAKISFLVRWENGKEPTVLSCQNKADRLEGVELNNLWKEPVQYPRFDTMGGSGLAVTHDDVLQLRLARYGSS